MQTTDSQPLPAGLMELKALFSNRLQTPLPDTYEGRVDLLEDYLKEVTRYLENAPRTRLLSGPEQIAQGISFGRGISGDIRDALKKSAAERTSDCDAAAVTGVALITVGAVGGGPVGAVAGFVYGVALLAASC